MVIDSAGAIFIGNKVATAPALYSVGTTGTTTCTARCAAAEPASLDVDSGACLSGWRSDTNAPITCADATSIAKSCLCAGVL